MLISSERVVPCGLQTLGNSSVRSSSLFLFLCSDEDRGFYTQSPSLQREHPIPPKEDTDRCRAGPQIRSG